jgi:hypothetical protein
MPASEAMDGLVSAIEMLKRVQPKLAPLLGRALAARLGIPRSTAAQPGRVRLVGRAVVNRAAWILEARRTSVWGPRDRRSSGPVWFLSGEAVRSLWPEHAMTESGQVFDRLAIRARTPQLRTSNTACQQKAQHDRRDDGRVAGTPLAAPSSGRHFASVCRGDGTIPGAEPTPRCSAKSREPAMGRRHFQCLEPLKSWGAPTCGYSRRSRGRVLMKRRCAPPEPTNSGRSQASIGNVRQEAFRTVGCGRTICNGRLCQRL